MFRGGREAFSQKKFLSLPQKYIKKIFHENLFKVGVLTKNPRQLREILGLILLFFSLLIGLSLWSHSVADPTFNHSVSASAPIQNYAGTFGAYLSGFLTDTFGLASYIWVAFFFGMGISLVTRWLVIPWYSMIGYLILTISFITLSEALTLGVGDVQGGGMIGAWFYAQSYQYFNPMGSIIVWLLLVLLSLQLCFGIAWMTGVIIVLTGMLTGTKAVAKKVPTNIKALPLNKLKLPKKGDKDVIDITPTEPSGGNKKAISAYSNPWDDEDDTYNKKDDSKSKDNDFDDTDNKENPKDPFGFGDTTLEDDFEKFDRSFAPKEENGEEKGGIGKHGDYDGEDIPPYAYDDEYDEYDEYDEDDEDADDDDKNFSKTDKDGLSAHDKKDTGENNTSTSKNTSEATSKEAEEKKDKEGKKKGFWSSVFGSSQGSVRGEKDDSNPKDSEKKGARTAPSMPSTDLLTPPPEDNDMPSKESLDEKGARLMQGLQDYNVNGELAGILPGPVVTMFEIRPERGVKAKRFESLSKEISMAIKAIAIRVQAPIPGTDTVGIEVPNEKRQLVSFREVIESDAFQKNTSLLTLGIGKDIFGNPHTGRLEEMPHLLVAGATGAGKSVCLNSIILSILYKARPHEVKFLLIDPKRVELAMYADLPHLVHPVVTDVDLAKNALLWAIDEMDQRYKLFQTLQVRNFNEYNTLIHKQELARKKKEAERAAARDAEHEDYTSDYYDDEDIDSREKQEAEEKLKALPYLVIIVDELADLMMQKGKEVEASIVRLAQLARAAGIHLIIATQRPSVDVVTGLIKANFPSRIAFQVTSGMDSRTILDSVGAETLLGKGDMLYKPRAGGLQRMHGAFVTDEEVRSVVNFWKQEQKVEYLIDFTSYGTQADETSHHDHEEGFDSLYDTVLERVLEMDEVSISMLQRQFKLGFGRAGRIMDQLHREGIVAAQQGSKARKVLK